MQRYNIFLDFANSILHFLQKTLIFGRKSISPRHFFVVILQRYLNNRQKSEDKRHKIIL